MKRHVKTLLIALVLFKTAAYGAVDGPKRATYFNAQRSLLGVIDYFKHNEAEVVNPDAVVLIENVQRIYGVDLEYSFSADSDFMAQFNKAFKKLHDDSFRVDKPVFDNMVRVRHSFNSNSMRALYCDQFPLPIDFLESLSKAVDDGAYHTTHAGFQLQIAVNNGCLDTSAAEVKAIMNKLVLRLQDVANNDTANVDICIEAMAVLVFLGRSELLSRNWVHYILNRQLSDGGFPATSLDTVSHPHTSGLALWVLLELAYNSSVEPVFDAPHLDEDAKLVQTLSTDLNPVLLAANWFVGKQFGVNWTLNFVEALFSSESERKRHYAFLRFYKGLFTPSYELSGSEIERFSLTNEATRKSYVSLYGLYCGNMNSEDTILMSLLSEARELQDDWITDLLLCSGFMQEHRCFRPDSSQWAVDLRNDVCDVQVKKNAVSQSGLQLETEALLWYACSSHFTSREMIDFANAKLKELKSGGLSSEDDDRVPIYAYWVSMLNKQPKQRIRWIGY